MKNLLLLALAATMLSSCSTRYLTHPLFQSDMQYMNKPMSTDSVRHATYAFGTLALATGDKDFTTSSASGILNFYQSYTFKQPNISLSYGVIGAAGSYEQAEINNQPKFSKSFQSIGGNFSAAFYLPRKQVDWRVIGVDLVYNKEFGDYARLRKNLTNRGYYDFISPTGLFTYGIFTEVAVKPSDKVSLMFKVGFNNSPGQPHELHNSPFNNANFDVVVNIRRFSIIYNLKFMPTKIWLQSSGFQFGTGYRF